MTDFEPEYAEIEEEWKLDILNTSAEMQKNDGHESYNM